MSSDTITTAEIIATTVPPERSILRVVARNTMYMLGGQVLIKILSFVFNICVVRRLGDAHFGRYSTALAYVAIFAMLTDLGMSGFSVREMTRKANKIVWMVPNIIALRAILSIVAIVGITLSAWLMGKTPDMVLGIFIASCGLLLYAFQGPLDSVVITQERLDYSSAFRLLNQMVFMVMGTISLLVGAGYIGLLLSSLLGVLAMGLGSAYIVRRVLALRFERPSPRHWWPLLRASFPFGVSGVTREFARRFDTVYMSFVLTDAAVGWYNVPYGLILMVMLMAESLALSMYPTLVKEYDSGRGSIQSIVQRALRYLLLLSLPMAVGGTLLAPQVIIALYGREFAPAVPAMQVLVWALPSMYLAQILGYTASTMHLEKKVARVNTITVLINVTLDVILIPKLGIVGAAAATAIAWLFRIIQLSWIIGPTMLFKGNVMSLLRILGAGGLMGGVVWRLCATPFLLAWDDKIALLLIIGAGAAVYGVATLVLRAVSPVEARYVYGAAGRRLRKLWPDK